MQLDMLDRTYVLIRKKAFARTTLLVLGIFVLSAVPRLLQLDYFLMVDENLWYERSARFLQGLVSGNLAQTVQTGHPGVTTMWSGTIGLLLHYVRAALPGESLVQFVDRMITTPATLTTLRLLRLPLALLSALSVVLAFVLGKRLLGMGPALAGAVLMAFEPLFVAHSRVLHHDSPAADFSLLAVLGWLLYLKEERRRYLLLAGVGIALAILSKVSSVFLLGFAGLTLLPLIWQKRQHLWPGLWAVALQWLQLLGITCLVIVLVWPAVWAAPGAVGNTVFQFITNESGPHANGTFFMGHAVPDPGPLFYPFGLAFALTPLTLGGLILALLGLGLAWSRPGRAHAAEAAPNRRWATWLLVYAVLFVIFMSLISKKQERYVLPAVVVLDLLAGWGYQQLLNPRGLLSRAGEFQIPHPQFSILLLLVLLVGQFAFAWPTAPYYSTFYNPLLGGAAQAQKVLLIGRGEGLEQAVHYVQSQAGGRIPQVASWYGTTVATLFEDGVDVKDISHPQYILSSDYVIFYINQWQRRLPEETILRYVQRGSPVYPVQLAGIDYAYVYQGKAIAHPVDPFTPQNRLVDKASLAGFDLAETPVAGAQVPLRLFWVNDGMQSDEHFYVRLTDALEQDWAWGSCSPDPAFGDATVWQKDDIIESQCQLVIYPGTPPGDYLLRVGIIAGQDAVVGQINLLAEEGTVTVARPVEFPTDEWVPVEHRVQSSLNDDLALIGYDYESEGVRAPGETIPVTFYWRALLAMDDDYLIRLTLQGDGPGQYAQWEGRPVNGRYPTRDWQTTEVVRDPWQLRLPASLPGGTYELAMTLTNQNGRESGHLALGTLTVQGREHAFSLVQPPQVAQPMRLGEAVRFLGYDLEGAIAGERLIPGQDLQVIFTWQAETTPEQNYTVFVQLLNAANQVQSQHDGQPGNGMLITTTWAPGEYVRDTHHLALPSDLPVGDYRLIVGMYLPDSGERLPVFDRADHLVGDYITLSTPLHVP
jgi:hypothetical protein